MSVNRIAPFLENQEHDFSQALRIAVKAAAVEAERIAGMAADSRTAEIVDDSRTCIIDELHDAACRLWSAEFTLRQRGEGGAR